LVLAQRQRQLAIVVAVTGEHVEGVELHLAIVFAKASKSASPEMPRTTASASSTKCVCLILNAVSTIHG
jgi:hypothetical protein